MHSLETKGGNPVLNRLQLWKIPNRFGLRLLNLRLGAVDFISYIVVTFWGNSFKARMASRNCYSDQDLFWTYYYVHMGIIIVLKQLLH